MHYDCSQLESCLGSRVLRANLDPLLQHPLPAECQRVVKAKLARVDTGHWVEAGGWRALGVGLTLLPASDLPKGRPRGAAPAHHLAGLPVLCGGDQPVEHHLQGHRRGPAGLGRGPGEPDGGEGRTCSAAPGCPRAQQAALNTLLTSGRTVLGRVGPIPSGRPEHAWRGCRKVVRLGVGGTR